jgi:hypothetical protein
MALFQKSREIIASVEPSVKAAVGASSYSPLRSFVSWQQGQRRARSMTLPVIVRGRDLICNTIAGMKLEMYREMWNGEEMEEVPLAPRSWLSRIDKSVPNQFIICWSIDDLIFEGRCFWLVEERSADGYPMSFTRLPAAMVQTLDQQGECFFGPSKQIVFNGIQLDPRDVIQFISPMQSLNSTGARAVEIALRVEESRLRASQSVLPSGYLKQTGGEPLSAQELSDLAAQFNLARTSGNNTAALNEFLEYVPTQATPDKMLMIESADYSARDLGRILGVPSYLLSVSIGAYSYQSSQQSRIDLWTYACKALADCITETLSSDNVLPHGTYVCFDTESFLAEAYMDANNGDDRMNETDIPLSALVEN